LSRGDGERRREQRGEEGEDDKGRRADGW